MIRRLVLDVLKPHEPGLVELARGLLAQLEVEGVTATLIEIEEDVRSIRVVIEGDALDLDRIDAVIDDLGASIHSIDQVCVGERIVRDEPDRQR